MKSPETIKAEMVAEFKARVETLASLPTSADEYVLSWPNGLCVKFNESLTECRAIGVEGATILKPGQFRQVFNGANEEAALRLRSDVVSDTIKELSTLLEQFAE
jgi:hypothetical protein